MRPTIVRIRCNDESGATIGTAVGVMTAGGAMVGADTVASSGAVHEGRTRFALVDGGCALLRSHRTVTPGENVVTVRTRQR